MSGRQGEVVREDYRDITRDPREAEDWFERLPPQVQEELRDAWAKQRVQHVPWTERNRRMRNRCLREGILALLLPAVLIGGWRLALVALPLGAVLGASWATLRTGRMRSACLAMGAMLVLVTASGFWSSRYDFVAFFFSAFGILIAGFLAAMMGLRRELDRREQAL